MSNTRLYWLHCLSPTHAGIGRGVGYIDLPIDRDGVTGWPIIRGSSFKGVWADHYGVKMVPNPGDEVVDGKTRSKDRRKVDTQEGLFLKAAFGIAGENDESNSGALIPTDAKIVCLPVRSFRGTFAWVTSPMCLQMLRRTLDLAGISVKDLPPAPTELAETDSHHYEENDNKCLLIEGHRIFLEDLDFMAKKCNTATKWAIKIGEWVFGKDDPWCKEFQKRFVVLPDAAFDFLCETGTEVHTRIKINDEMKVVEDGMLWTEESLPAETILMGIIQCERVFQKGGAAGSIKPDELLNKFAPVNAAKPLALQIGGKATVGRGQVRCVFTGVK